jgi:hypothetical protein
MIQVMWGRNVCEDRTSSRITGWNIAKTKEKDLKNTKEV